MIYYHIFKCAIYFQKIITHRLSVMPFSDRNEIRITLWNYYVGLTSDAPKIRREKFAQLIALLGKQEFPNDHPGYTDDIRKMLTSNFHLGIILLRTTSEEVTSTKEDISSDGKQKFRHAYVWYKECKKLYMKLI